MEANLDLEFQSKVWRWCLQKILFRHETIKFGFGLVWSAWYWLLRMKI